MQKISYVLLDKILKKCSKKEIDVILYCSQFQNELGNVRDITYKYTCLYTHISKNSFYKILRSLEKKEIIIINWLNSEKDWSFTFVDNQILNYKDMRKGYLKTNFFFLHELDFMKLDVKSKRLILKLLKVYRSDSQFKIGLEKLGEWIGIKSKDKILSYVKILKNFFNITEYNGLLTIKLKKYNQLYTDSDLYKTLHHKITSFCSNYKVAYTIESIKELYFIFADKKAYYSKIVSAICNTVFRYRSIEPGIIKYIVY